MKSFLYAVLVINSLHSYLLITQRDKRGLTISEHAARSNFTHMLYIVGHLVGGVLFIGFARWFFIDVHSNHGLYLLTVSGVAVEWLQAFIPARNKFERYHLLLAILMSVLITILGLASTLILPIHQMTRVICLAIGVLLVLSYPLALRLPRKYFWIIEMVNINLFYIQMLLIIRS